MQNNLISFLSTVTFVFVSTKAKLSCLPEGSAKLCKLQFWQEAKLAAISWKMGCLKGFVFIGEKWGQWGWCAWKLIWPLMHREKQIAAKCQTWWLNQSVAKINMLFGLFSAGIQMAKDRICVIIYEFSPNIQQTDIQASIKIKHV